ncbi:MAG: hypothetical protein ACOCV2_03575 [Persicimonas sp.]
MSNFLKLNAQIEGRIGQYATRLLRVEAHLRRGEKRAALARLDGLYDEIEEYMRELEFPTEMVLVGAQIGLLSGKGSFVRGRLPGALIGAVAGWMYGQSSTTKHHRQLAEIAQRAALIERALVGDAGDDESEDDDASDTEDAERETEKAPSAESA